MMNGLTRDRLSTTRVTYIDELLDQDGVLLVIPVAENHGEFFVVLVMFSRRMYNERSAKPIYVLALFVVNIPTYNRKEGVALTLA
jgi:predicted site-specific integrase-resolvase